MRNSKQETIADIVAAMRDEGHAGDASCLEWVSAKFTSYANRIEAAAKREREAGAEAAQICGEIGEMIGREATREKSSRVGNAAKMRNALENVYSTLERLNPYLLHIDDMRIRREFRGMLCHAKNATDFAISAPPRNCDIGNALEQVSRHRIWCKCGGGCAVSCKMCFAKWSQMPYEEGGAK